MLLTNQTVKFIDYVGLLVTHPRQLCYTVIDFLLRDYISLRCTTVCVVRIYQTVYGAVACARKIKQTDRNVTKIAIPCNFNVKWSVGLQRALADNNFSTLRGTDEFAPSAVIDFRKSVLKFKCYKSHKSTLALHISLFFHCFSLTCINTNKTHWYL